jgi:hypothetical protein
VSAAYFAAAFVLAPHEAIESLTQHLDHILPAEQTHLAIALLPRMFGDAMLRSAQLKQDLPFEVLRHLTFLAYRTIRPEDDIHRPSNKVYSPEAQDHAQAARSAVFGRLAETPGRATYMTLQEMASTPGFPISPDHLRELAVRRAIKDARLESWRPGDAARFEEECEHAPITALALQELLEWRIKAFEHQLVHGDFKQARTLKRLEKEALVQNWIAEHLKSARKSSYGVHREPERADAKKPDIVITAKESDANLAIEIKVADGMTVQELEKALTDQLCGKYLRATGGRYGILLVVYQRRRPHGWHHPINQNLIQFGEVIEHLQAKARDIAAQCGDSPQPVIGQIDVSGVDNGG